MNTDFSKNLAIATRVGTVVLGLGISVLSAASAVLAYGTSTPASIMGCYWGLTMVYQGITGEDLTSQIFQTVVNPISDGIFEKSTLVRCEAVEENAGFTIWSPFSYTRILAFSLFIKN